MYLDQNINFSKQELNQYTLLQACHSVYTLPSLQYNHDSILLLPFNAPMNMVREI